MKSDSESHTWGAEMNFCLYFPDVLSHFDAVQRKTSVHYAIQHW
jgi:hypothetical protein